MTYLVYGTQAVQTQKKEEVMEQEVRLHMSRRLHSFNGQYLGSSMC